MVQYDEKPVSPRGKRKREPVADKSVEEKPSTEKSEESFLICDDCGHNSIRYDPSKDGACDCGCH
jgi:hypothetical protein